MREELLLELIRDLKEKIFVYPHMLSLIILVHDLLVEGLEKTLTRYRDILGTNIDYLRRCEYIINREIGRKNNAIISKLDLCIIDPDLRLKLLNNFLNKHGFDQLCSDLSLGNDLCSRMKKQVEILRREYDLLKYLFYKPINNYLELAVYLNTPLNELILTRELIKRSKWLADIVAKNNNLIISGPSFTGKTTHLFMASHILMKKHNLKLATGPSPQNVPRTNIYVGDDLGLEELRQLQGRRYIVSIKSVKVDLLDKILPREKIVLGNEDIGKPIHFKNKTVILALTDQLYSPSEIQEISNEKLLERTDNLKILHIRQYTAKNRLKEEYDNITDLLKRLITRYYYIRKYAPLIGFITAYHGLNNVTTRNMIMSITRYRNAYGDPSLLLGNINTEIYTIPHKEWILSLKKLCEDENISEIIDEIKSFLEDIYSLRKNIAYKIENPIEALVLANNYPELLVETINKGSIKTIHVSPIHFLEHSRNPDVLDLKKNIIMSKDISNAAYYLILFMLKNRIEADYLDIIRKYKIPKKQSKKLIAIINNSERSIEEYIKQYRGVKDTLLKKILIDQMIDKIILHKQVLPLLDHLYKIGSHKLEQKIFYLTGEYSKLRRLLEKKKLLNKQMIIMLDYLSGRINRIISSTDPISEYYKANIYLRIGDLDRSMLSINRSYIGAYNRLINGELNFIYTYMRSLYKLAITNLLKKRINDAQAIINKFLEDIDSYGHIVEIKYLNPILSIIRSLKEIHDKHTCSYNHLECLKASILLDEQGIFRKHLIEIIRDLNKLELYEILELGRIIRNGLLKKWVSSDLVETYLNSIEKYISIPRFKYVYLSIVPLYMVRKKRIDKKYLELDNQYNELLENYGIWAKKIYLDYLYAKGIYYVKIHRNPGKAKYYFKKALELLNEFKNISRRVYARKRNILELWINISEIQDNDYSTCHKSLKNILTRKLSPKMEVMANYWFIKCLIGNKLYRTALEKASETVLTIRDPINRLKFMTLLFIISYRINYLLAEKSVEEIINYVYEQLRKKKITYSMAIQSISRLIIMQWKHAGSYGIGKSINTLIDLLETANLDSIKPNIKYLKRVVIILSELNKLDYINKILSKIIGTINDPELILLHIDSLLINGRYEEAERQLEKISRIISKDIRQAYEAQILYYKGKIGKAMRKANKIIDKINRLDLKAKLLYIIGKALEYKGKTDKAVKAYTALLEINEARKHLPLNIIGDTYYRLATYYHMKKAYNNALKYYELALKTYDKIVFENQRFEQIIRISEILQNILSAFSNIENPFFYGEAKELVCGYISERYEKINMKGLTNMFIYILNSCK
ncbi:tetratricopeptide repeat protein [Staphylothermus hellenicus]|uniref:Tetratricopeptide TPR_2 repeat protein n=1 Tax=Staphylothermus hellenicus (strain DSM 12710 / JCM 10830 / BK20S6-10-b1 / P8) TaxID=591019 RepID=D7D846_STAHD|nr:hypothetical protein [Staphylothermus hellenicus]ADI31942.1 Tetratricopeptide TPR_2 repeat protein [Staphylothermus hellenicus DSM 12710]